MPPFYVWIDGDTITVDPNDTLPAANPVVTEHSVRILGIETPELNTRSADPAECGAEEATEFLTQLLNTNPNDLSLVFDARADRVDRHGRTLAYVDLADGTDVGADLVQAGHAIPWYPNGEPEPARVPDYEQAANTAADNGRGSWGHCDQIGRH